MPLLKYSNNNVYNGIREIRGNIAKYFFFSQVVLMLLTDSDNACLIKLNCSLVYG
jgi:hypothetical protein